MAERGYSCPQLPPGDLSGQRTRVSALQLKNNFVLLLGLIIFADLKLSEHF